MLNYQKVLVPEGISCGFLPSDGFIVIDSDSHHVGIVKCSLNHPKMGLVKKNKNNTYLLKKWHGGLGDGFWHCLNHRILRLNGTVGPTLASLTSPIQSIKKKRRSISTQMENDGVLPWKMMVNG